jgi:hypothetical protein
MRYIAAETSIHKSATDDLKIMATITTHAQGKPSPSSRYPSYQGWFCAEGDVQIQKNFQSGFLTFLTNENYEKNCHLIAGAWLSLVARQGTRASGLR